MSRRTYLGDIKEKMENRLELFQSSSPDINGVVQKRSRNKATPRSPRSRTASPLKMFDANIQLPPNERLITDLKIQLANYDAKCDDLQLELDKKSSKLEYLRQQFEKAVKDKNAFVIKHDQTVASLEDKIASQAEAFEIERNQLISDKKFFEERCNDLRSELDKVCDGRKDLEIKLLNSTEEVQKLTQAMVMATQDIEGAQKRVEDLEKLCVSKDDEIAELREQVSRLQEDHFNGTSPAVSNKPSLEESIFPPDSNNAASNEPMSLFAEIALNDKDVEINSLRKQLSSLQLHDSEKTSEIEILRNKNSELSKTLQSFQEELKTRNLEIIKLNEEIISLNSKLKDSYRDLKKSIDKTVALKDKANQVEKLLNKDINKKAMEINRLSEVIRKQEEQLASMKCRPEEELRELEVTLAAERKIKQEYAKQNIILENRLKQIYGSKDCNCKVAGTANVNGSTTSLTVTDSACLNGRVETKSTMSTTNSTSSLRPEKSHDSVFRRPNISSHPHSVHNCSSVCSTSSSFSNTGLLNRMSGRREQLYAAVPEPKDKRVHLPRGTGQRFRMADEEGEVNAPKCLAEAVHGIREADENVDARLSILKARNAQLAPHLKSSYPVELNLKVGEKAVREGNV